MKLLRTALLASLAFAGVLPIALNAAPPPDLRQQMTPGEFKAAGLDKLTPDELAALSAWMQAEMDRKAAAKAAPAPEAPVATQPAAPARPAPQPQAPATTARPAAPTPAVPPSAPATPAVAQAPTPTPTPEQSFGAEAIPQPKAQEKAEPEELDSIDAAIDGKFRGWDGYTRFKLDNGQEWMQAQAGKFIVRQMTNPKVTIRRGMFGAYFLSVEGYGKRVKVVRVK